MLPLKIVRSLVFGDALNHPTLFSQPHRFPLPDEDEDEDEEEEDEDHGVRSRVKARRRHKRTSRRNTPEKIPVLVFLPTRQLVTSTYSLANLARSLGIDIRPDPSLSHIVFAPPAPSTFPSSSASPSTSTLSPTCSNLPPPSTSPSSFSFSFSSTLEDGVALPFPSLSSASLLQLQSFVSISKGFFRIALLRPDCPPNTQSHLRGNLADDRHGDWDCCSYSLFSRVSNERVDTMDGFCRVLAGSGWTFYRTRKEGLSSDRAPDWGRGGSEVYLFRKVDLNRVWVRAGGNSGDNCRVRELRLPSLDFGNAPLRILQYVLLMTEDVFYLA